MSTHSVSRRFPEYLNERRWCRNGQAPDGRFIARAGDAINHIVAYRRNTIMEKALNVRDIPAGVATAPLELWHCGTHIGHGVSKVVAIVVLAKANSALAADPYITMAVRDGFSGGSVTASNELHYGAIDASASDTPNEYYWGGQLECTVTEDTDYRIWFRLYDYARLVSVCVFEWGTIPVDTANGGTVNPEFGAGSAITDSEQADYLAACTDLWKDNGCQVFNWVAENPTRAPTSVGYASYTNVFDKSSTSVTANTPGVRVNLQYHNTANAATVPVKAAFRAERTAGGTGAANAYRITDGSGTNLEVTNIDALGWYTVTGKMLATADQKFDIQATTVTGPSVATLKLHAVCLFEDE